MDNGIQYAHFTEPWKAHTQLNISFGMLYPQNRVYCGMEKALVVGYRLQVCHLQIKRNPALFPYQRWFLKTIWDYYNWNTPYDLKEQWDWAAYEIFKSLKN